MSSMSRTEEWLAEYQAKRRAAKGGSKAETIVTPPAIAKPIIKQSRKEPTKPERLLKTLFLEPMLAAGKIDEIGEHESIRLKLANGLTYKPDYPTWKGDKLTFYEVKGEQVWEDSLKSLKVAAHQYKRFGFYLYKYAKGEWTWQEVLP